MAAVEPCGTSTAEKWVLHIGICVIRGMYEHDVLLLAEIKHAAKLVVLWLVQTVPVYFAYSVGMIYNARPHKI
jgi:hypothetical protein